ncbi:hypothetical protein UlMin_024245 [Ulmus minor]
MIMPKPNRPNKTMNTETKNGSQLGDTTHTKIFVGGLAWRTQMETMKRYFEQFGEISEAVVIVDKLTGRSKGYGFVTFKDRDSASKACDDPNPIIDGRRTNCNLAAFGAQKTHPTTPQRGMGKFRASSMTPMVATPNIYGFSTYLYQHIPEYAAYGYPFIPLDNFAVNYYNAYGGQDFQSHYSNGGPGFVYLSSYPYLTLHDSISPRTNPKTLESVSTPASTGLVSPTNVSIKYSRNRKFLFIYIYASAYSRIKNIVA